ncbi:NAC domain-containing protein 17-like [Cucurbita pepo subsp. pepo]|uniref:NAC domain-containing protein 17-like n=1 Tax=Cucurbita pepo subsp. pepo TaxID=3664 RepID=UPI000C9D7AB3|nr:NAC domain-containing protein 17-like [Cucurbita pepo subsp. pepo]
MELLSRSSAGEDNGFPPGFRFHPTDEEIILYYLKRKICGRRIKLDIVGDIDVYKWEPEELPGLSKLKTGDRQWFFFSPRDRKYPHGARSNRATRHGYWKATGKDRTVTCNSRDVGVKKTLIFYRGRAPSGERTDWVMHEYTMTEEELGRCINVKNYYAVYKVFKKSGPGPKNGEQYGAPFKEEDWVDDEFCDFNFDDKEKPAEKPNTDTTATESENRHMTHLSLDDLDMFMIQLSNEPLLEFPEADPCANSLPQDGRQEESGCPVVDLCLQEHNLPRSVELSSSEQQPSNVPESIDLTKSDRPFQTPEAKSSPNLSELTSFLFEDDFLEIDDLGGPEFNLSTTEKGSGTGNLQFEELNGLCNLDQFHDAAMFLNDMGPLEYGTIPNLFQNENVDILASPLDVQFQSNPNCASANQIDNQMLIPDLALQDGFALSELPQTSGVLCDPSNQNEVGKDVSSASRVSSALWAFVESIPSTPASAAENGLVNRSFDRISSFGRKRVSTNSTMVSAIDSSSIIVSSSRRTASRSRKGGFFVFSVLGALCAILWVFIGAVRLWHRCISL